MADGSGIKRFNVKFRFFQEKLSMVNGEKRVMMCHATSTFMCHAMLASTFHAMSAQLMPQDDVSCHVNIHVSCHINIVVTSTKMVDFQWLGFGDICKKSWFLRIIIDGRWLMIGHRQDSWETFGYGEKWLMVDDR
jgi:hypothetical protein